MTDDNSDQPALDLSPVSHLHISNAPFKTRIYRCRNGHEMTVQGEWLALAVGASEGQAKYQFCFHCWGEWAQKQWPLTCEEVER